MRLVSRPTFGNNLEIRNRRSRTPRTRQSFAWMLAGVLLAVSDIAVAQDPNQNRTLIVNGQSENVPVIQVDGRSYVDLEGLTRAANGSFSFSGNQIALAPPDSAANLNATSAPAAAIQNGTPVAANWLGPYRNQAAVNLRLASIAIQTNSDRRALQLLSNEFQNIPNSADKYITARNNMTYVSPDALQNDDLYQRIVACGHSLAAMAASN